MAFIWGIPYLFIKIAVGELTPASLVFLRAAIGTVLLLPLAAARGAMTAQSPRPARHASPSARTPARPTARVPAGAHFPTRRRERASPAMASPITSGAIQSK